MQAKLTWVDGVAFMAQADSGHGQIIDGSPDIGGRNLGSRPMELVLMGLASCSAMDVMSILKKARQQVTDCVITADAERADSIPKVFTRIHLTYRVTGRALKPNVVERAVKLSMETYCSVSKMLAKTAEITHAVELVDAD
jgi:putative redox protein